MMHNTLFLLIIISLISGCAKSINQEAEKELESNLVEESFFSKNDKESFSSMKRILFSDIFGSSKFVSGDSYMVQIPPDSILIFDGKGPYYLDGNPLIINAKKAVIEATTTIISFRPDSVASLKQGEPPGKPQATGYKRCNRGWTGCEGNDGEDGSPGDDKNENKGRDGSQISLLVDEVIRVGDSRLIVNATGEKGGKGQKGGRGGQGAVGQPGESQDGPPSCAGPGKGGPGGFGGAPGRGGVGGQGGNGGVVYLSSALHKLWLENSDLLEINIQGGPGGDPGNPGEPGISGPGGPDGECNGGLCSCTHRDRGDVVGKGPIKPKLDTPPSEPGFEGYVALHGCDVHVEGSKLQKAFNSSQCEKDGMEEYCFDSPIDYVYKKILNKNIDSRIYIGINPNNQKCLFVRYTLGTRPLFKFAGVETCFGFGFIQYDIVALTNCPK